MYFMWSRWSSDRTLIIDHPQGKPYDEEGGNGSNVQDLVIRSLKNVKKLILVAYNWKTIGLDMLKKNDKQEKKRGAK